MDDSHLRGTSYREWAAEPPATVSPASFNPTAKTMNVHAALGSAALRIGEAPLPILGRARVYVCGITPYETTHVGHAATFVWADVAARVSAIGRSSSRRVSERD